MTRIVVFLILLPLLLFGDLDTFFSDNHDPTNVHHVNVLTGHLHFAFQDVAAEGAVPISLTRTYSSSSALDTDDTYDALHLYELGYNLPGGWKVLPHAHLILLPKKERKDYEAYLAEPGGSIIAYKYCHTKDKHKDTIYLRPKKSSHRASGQLSARTAFHNNLLEVNLKSGEATLFLPDGGKRIYRGDSLHHYASDPSPRGKYSYALQREISPSLHQLHYIYDGDLKRIEAKNPSGQKVYSHITFDRGTSWKVHAIQIKTSDSKEIRFHTEDKKTKDHQTLRCNSVVQSNVRPTEKSYLKRGRKGTDPRLIGVDLDGKSQFRVEYFCPSDREHELKWEDSPEKKHFYIDKVAAIYGPLGPGGAEIPIATFTYNRDRSTVRDAEGILTEYRHDGEKPSEILYYDSLDRPHLKQTFLWCGAHLHSKAMLNGEGRMFFSKTFAYDGDNVIEEVLWGDLTGEEAPRSNKAPRSPYSLARASHFEWQTVCLDSFGQPKLADAFRKTYSYYKDRWNLLQSVKEDDGPTTEYSYHQGTDLIAAKLTKDPQGRIVTREFFFYDGDHFLIHEISDNGHTADPHNLSQVTQRIEKFTQRNPQTSLPEEMIEAYWDLPSRTKKLLRKTKLTYANQKVTEEAIYDANNTYRYSIHTTYDIAGRVTTRQEPHSSENTYQYNPLGLLAWAKEVGSAAKIYTYDAANRLLTSTNTETGKTTSTSYGPKDQILLQTDERGNTTHYQYDRLGNRTATLFPKVQDQNGLIQEPTATFSYNALGDLTTSALPLGQVTQTTYNLLRKPVRIIQADGTQIRHLYNRNGTLAKTTYPDGAQDTYQYDFLQRMTAKKISSAAGEILSQEHWEYDAYHLCKYTAPNGLETRFFYDGAGRKIAEEAGDRRVTLTYDALGFVERTDNGAVIYVQKHNVLGLVEEEWQEDALTGQIENRMRFVYDSERRKIQAIRWTSQGEAIDHFAYQNDKLCKHTDPQGGVTQFLYDEDHLNDLGQRVLQKTTINPLGHATIETYDAANRLVSQDKRDASGQTVFKEEYFYDLAGNRAKRLSYIYHEAVFQKTIETTWAYDVMGRVVEELEANQKKTSYVYDVRGRLAVQTLPNGVQLFFTYDGLGRLLKRHSSDGTVSDVFEYDRGSNPTRVIDHVRGIVIHREYNALGEVIREHSRGKSTCWDYDAVGRTTALGLPDGSSIRYHYQGAHLRAVERYARSGELLYKHTYDQFDANGRVAEESLMRDLGKVRTSHDLLERPLSLRSSWLEHSCTYGPSGLVMGEQNTLLGDKVYAYDPLDQLIQEGATSYRFDSLSNPADATVNDLNQIVESKGCQFAYDARGNPVQRACGGEEVSYTFDALGRLTGIVYGAERKVDFTYDPFSRLFAKATYLTDGSGWQLEAEQYYLYDREREIGVMDAEGCVRELKVLGLGVSGDIGAAVAIELGGDVYAPLHDFHGHVIAIVDAKGHVAEQYAMDAFGREVGDVDVDVPSKNSWRFCSKRSDERLIFFGLRFYDPSLGRWLSPDPAGFVDGPNLYAYVRNSPTNRLDLFGLYEEEIKSPFFGPGKFTLPINILPPDNGLVHVKLVEGEGILTDYFISCGYWHELEFTPQEQESGVFNLLDHKELSPAAGQINLVTFMHGINTSLDELKTTGQWIVDQIPGTLFIARYSGIEGLFRGVCGASKDMCNVETEEACRQQQFLLACSEGLQKLNPAVFDSSGALKQLGALWMHIDHSRGGAVDRRAIEGMSAAQRKALQTQLLMTCVAPALTMPRYYAMEAKNFYSNQDFFTGGVGKPRLACGIIGEGLGGKAGKVVGWLVGALCFDRSDCDIEFVPCISKLSERTFGADHAIMGGTYRGVMSDAIKDNRKKYGIYGKK